MLRSQLVTEIASRLDLPRIECDRVIDTMSEVIADTIAKGEDVKIRGFVNFEISEIKARKGDNPATGKLEKFDSANKVKCRVGKQIKDAVQILNEK